MEHQTLTLMNPFPGDRPEAAEIRQRQGYAIAAQTRIKRHRSGYKVPSQSGRGTHYVVLDEQPSCTCADFEHRGRPCKHIYAVELARQGKNLPDGDSVENFANRVTYGRDWRAYNASQTRELEHFFVLLRDLCDTVEQPPQTKGRPRLPLSDVLFGVTLKVYTTKSGRRAMSYFRDAQHKGLFTATPSFTSTFRYMESSEITDILERLIELSSLPLQSVECDFAADSTGFSTSIYNRWFDEKWGRYRRESKWVKLHVVCGVKTNIVTAVAITGPNFNDAPLLPGLVQSTASNFSVKEVSGDKAYLSKRNLHAVEAVGGKAYIPFKVNSTGHQGHHKRDALWEQAYHYYNLHREEFLSHYHKRSNVETTFAMIKAKFGGYVRSKTPVAQRNELLAKVLCHNLVVLIRSAYELDIPTILDPKQFCGDTPLAPIVPWDEDIADDASCFGAGNQNGDEMRDEGAVYGVADPDTTDESTEDDLVVATLYFVLDDPDDD